MAGAGAVNLEEQGLESRNSYMYCIQYTYAFDGGFDGLSHLYGRIDG
jgi:hypothetical protein